MFRVRHACPDGIALAPHRIVDSYVVLHQEEHVIHGNKIPLTAQYFLKRFQTRWPTTVLETGYGISHVMTKIGLFCVVLIYLSEHNDHSTSK
jgi:hypothetical protein